MKFTDKTVVRYIPLLFVPDSENRESLSKNGITHILSVYNNAKPVFEVSGKSTSAGSNNLFFLWKFYLDFGMIVHIIM